MFWKQAADYPEVFEYFGIAEHDRPVQSCYLYAPVFPAVVAGRPVAIKQVRRCETAASATVRWARALADRDVAVVTPLDLDVPNPALVGDDRWVAYPWVEGRPYGGSGADIVAAGDLLGRLHAAGADLDPDPDLPPFPWPDHDQASIDEDVDGLRRVLGTHAPQVLDAVLARMAPLLQSFMTTTLPAIRDRGLPSVPASIDYKASNLVYVAGAPVLIDPDGAERVPRVLDLAMAALLFHVEQPTAPPRLFTPAEWALFSRAYARHVALEPSERELWPTALRYMLLEWGTWTLIDADEWGDWADEHKCAFLVDLALTDEHRYELPP